MPDRPRRIPEATVTRLPIYLRILTELGGERGATVSSERLAELAGVNAAKVRKDLSYLGSYGTRGVGYEVEYLLFQVSRELGLTQDWPVVVVGVGNLGRALADYAGFTSRGFPVVALGDDVHPGTGVEEALRLAGGDAAPADDQHATAGQHQVDRVGGTVESHAASGLPGR